MTNDGGLLLGVFPSREFAETAIDALVHAGYSKDEMGMIAPGGKLEEAKQPTGDLEDNAATGAEAGALTGGTLGILAGAISVVAFPGLGLAVTGGILAVIATAAAAGAALGVFAGPFVAMGLSEREAKHYETHFKEGRTIVAVKVRDPMQQDEIVTLLLSHGATQVRTREGQTLAPVPAV